MKIFVERNNFGFHGDECPILRQYLILIIGNKMPSLDDLNRITIDEKDLFLFRSNYWEARSTIESFSPDWKTYCFQINGFGSIFTPLFHLYCLAQQFPASIHHPSKLCLCFLSQAALILKSMYRAEEVPMILFGSACNTAQFRESFLWKNVEIIIKSNSSTPYIEKKIEDIEIQDLSQIDYNEYDLKFMKRVLRQLPISYGQTRMFELEKMVAQTSPLYGFKICNSRSTKKEERKVLLLSTRYDRSGPQFMRNQKSKEGDLPSINLEDLLINIESLKLADGPKRRVLVKRLLKDLTQWLITYQWSANKPYPRLTPLAIFYNQNLEQFGLKPDPIIAEALGFHDPVCNHSWSMKERQMHQLYFSLGDDYSEGRQEVNNVARVLLCMRYLEGGLFFSEQDGLRDPTSMSQWAGLLSGMEKEKKGEKGEKEESICSAVVNQIAQGSGKELPNIFELGHILKLGSVVSDTHDKLAYIYWLKYRVNRWILHTYYDFQNKYLQENQCAYQIYYTFLLSSINCLLALHQLRHDPHDLTLETEFAKDYQKDFMEIEEEIEDKRGRIGEPVFEFIKGMLPQIRSGLQRLGLLECPKFELNVGRSFNPRIFEKQLFNCRSEIFSRLPKLKLKNAEFAIQKSKQVQIIMLLFDLLSRVRDENVSQAHYLVFQRIKSEEISVEQIGQMRKRVEMWNNTSRAK